MARTLAQVDARLTTEITTRSSQVSGLDSRLQAAEAWINSQRQHAQVHPGVATARGDAHMASLTIQMGTVAPPSATSVHPGVASAVGSAFAPATVSPPLTPSGPITVTQNGQVIQYLVIDSMPNQTMTLAGQTSGTTSSIYINGFTGVTIRHCLLRGRQWGILALNASGLILDDVQIVDLNYCGVGIFGGNNGQMTNLTVQRVGMLRDSSGNPSIGDPGNSYGVKFETAAAGGAVGTAAPSGWLIDKFLVEDVPLWQGINAHEVDNLTVQNGTVNRTPRGMFFAGTVSRINILNNQILSPVTRAGGTTDKSAISYGDLQTGRIDGNSIDHTFSNYINNIDAFLGGTPSSNVTIGTNPII